MSDKTNPGYYKAEKGFEVIDVIEAFTSSLDGVKAFDTANIIKYICRWHEKDGVHDLKKAKWYLEHLIAQAEIEEELDFYCQPMVFKTYQEAWSVLTDAISLIGEHGQLSIYQLYKLAGVTPETNPSYYKQNAVMDRKFGWCDQNSIKIVKIKDNWALQPSRPILLKPKLKKKRLSIRFKSSKEAFEFKLDIYRYFVDHDVLDINTFVSKLNTHTSMYVMEDETYKLITTMLHQNSGTSSGWIKGALTAEIIAIQNSEMDDEAYIIISMPESLEED